VPEEVLPKLTTKVMGRPYRYFADIASTNSYLRGRIAELPEGAAVVADAQSGGRGRFQREWFSPAGMNVHLSVLLKPAVPPAEAPPLSLVAAASVLRAIHEAGCPDATVKWPNDIMWQGRKLAGVLCEMEAEADLLHGVVMGIGVNVNVEEFPAALKSIATSLRLALGRAVCRPALVAGILNHLECDYGEWRRRGLAGLADFLNRHSYLAGREVTVALTREKATGRVDRITDEGTLRLVGPDGGTQEIGSGEVRLCRPARSGRRRKSP
jgi:BirA family biotin operon repressor/biotin-[acetyl-CoA-carboxylase] ligase